MTSTMATGISMAGTLKNMLATGFSTENCITELIDDSLGARATHVRLTLADGRLIVADNGCGMSRERLREAHVLNNRSAASATKHGRFGIGRKFALVGLTELKGSVRTLTRTADGDESQLDIDFSAAVRDDKLDLYPHDMARTVHPQWLAQAIEAESSGTVTVIPLAPAKMEELRGLLTVTDVRQSLVYTLALTYHGLLTSVNLEVVVDGGSRRIVGMNPLVSASSVSETLQIYRDRDGGDVRAYYEVNGQTCRYLTHDNRARKDIPEEVPAVGFDHLGEVHLRSAYCDDWLAVQNPILESLGLAGWNEKDTGVQDVRPFLGGTFIQRNGKIIHRTPAEKPKSNDKDPFTIASFRNSRHVIEFTPVSFSSEASADDIFTLDDVFNVQINKSKVDVEEIQKDVAFTCRRRFHDFRVAVCKKLAAAAPASASAPAPLPPTVKPVSSPSLSPVISMPEPVVPSVKPVVKVHRAATTAVVPVSERCVIDALEGFAVFLSTVDFETLKKEASHHMRPGAAALVSAIKDLMEFVED